MQSNKTKEDTFDGILAEQAEAEGFASDEEVNEFLESLDAHTEELFMQPENGHDEWVKSKVEDAIRRLESHGSEGRPMDEVHASVIDQVCQRLESKRKCF